MTELGKTGRQLTINEVATKLQQTQIFEPGKVYRMQ